MKCVLIAFAALVAVASASGISTYSVAAPVAAYSAPFAYPYAYAAPYAAPYATAYSAPYATAYAAPVAVAPAVQSGYVAATRGSLHVAPHPEGPFTASHHINTAPAPGTF